MDLNPAIDIHHEFGGTPSLAVQPPAFIHTVPPELLGEIFENCQTFNTIFIISYVCRRWRSFALNTPKLWSNITVIQPEMKHVPIIDLWLRRSENWPLSLVLTEVQRDPKEIPLISPYRASTDLVLALFVQHAARWKNFHFDLFSPHLSLLCIPQGGLKILECAIFTHDIWMDKPYIDMVWNIFYSAPTLRLVEWGERYLPSQAPWSQLTYARVDSEIDDHVALKILKECYNPRGVSFSWLLSRNPIISEMDSITLPRLRELAVSSQYGGNCGAFFQHLLLPALEKLDMRHHHVHSPGPPASILGDLLSRSSSPLKSLSIVDPHGAECTILDYLRLPSIQQITTLNLVSRLGDATAKLLTCQPNALTPDILPNLTVLRYELSCTSDNVLLNMVVSRSHRLEKLSAVIFVPERDACADDIAFLKNLIDRGHQVSLNLIHGPRRSRRLKGGRAR